VSSLGTRWDDRRDRLERLPVPEQDPVRRLGAVHVAVPVHDRALAEQFRVGPELALQVLPQLDVVTEVGFRFDPRELLAVEDDRFVEQLVRSFRVFAAEVLLRPVPDPVLLQPHLQSLLALAAPFALEFHPPGRVDHVGPEQFFDLLADPGLRGRFGVQERMPNLLSGDAELPEHLLAHEDRRELPLPSDVEDRPAPFPLVDEMGDLALYDVEPAGRVPRHSMRVNDEQ